MEKPAELLIRCLEDFGESEAAVAIVIFREQDGNLRYRVAEDCNISEAVGMLTCARETILQKWLADNSKPNGD